MKRNLLLRKCETCNYYKEVAGGPDHGDYRCTNENSKAYYVRVHDGAPHWHDIDEKTITLEKENIELMTHCPHRKGYKKTAIITGASRGIGKAISEELSGNFDLALISRHYDEVEQLSEELIRRNKLGFYLPFQCDIRDEKQVNEIFEEIYKQFGSIDVLVNNAGINSRKTLNTENIEQWFTDLESNLLGFDNEMATNLRGTYICSYLAAGHMLKHHHGSIINISSVKGKEATTSPGYGASKAGIIKLTRDFAKALAPYGISANCVAPGFIDTGMTAELSEDKKQIYRRMIPEGRFGTVEEVAKVVMWLVSNDSSYITGATIDVNGGYLMD